MFRSANQIEVDAATKKLDKIRDQWMRTALTWYDGTPASVDARIAKIDEVIAFAGHTAQLQGKAGSFCLAALPNLRANREELIALRRQLLGTDTGLITGPEDTGVQPLSPDTLGDMRSNISNWNDGAFTAACAGPECTGVKPLSPDRVHQMRDERNSWRDDEEPRHRHEDMGWTPDDITRLKGAAREFVEEQNTTDRRELLVRAQRAIEARTSGWTLSASQTTVRDFLAAVNDQIPEPVRTARRAPGVETVEDFDDHLMFS